MRYLGIGRDEKFSPNRVDDDAAVFHAVAAELERNFNKVIRVTEQELVQQGIPDGIDGIFQMARSREALDVLENATVPVTNTVNGVRNCVRARQTELMKGSGLIPESVVCSTSREPDGWKTYPCWIKRADSHAVDKDDVQYISDADSLVAVMRCFSEHGIRECVIQAHVRGWIVKFYGVKGYGLTDCYAATARDGKFGLERFNDRPQSGSVDMEVLTAVVERASDILGVDVYGGDAVISHDGYITLIDFNDWPSFRTCTDGAAHKIARLIMDKR